MAATLHQLRTPAERLRADQAAQLRQAVLAFPGLPERAAGEILATIDRQTAAENGWTFVMLSPSENDAVVSWLAAHSAKPQLAMRLWAKLFLTLRRDTGEILQSRDELAEAIKTTPRDVSRVMTELEGIGAISRRRQKVAGLRGLGAVRYFMSPRLGTHLTGAARDAAQEVALPLRLVPRTP